MILAQVVTSALDHADLWAFVIVIAAIVGALGYGYREFRRAKQWDDEHEIPPDGD